jgi:hypothetical protein
MASNNRNTNPNRIQREGLNDQPAALDTTRLDIFAEVASQQPYLPVPEQYPAPGLVLLARAALQLLGEDSNNSATATTGLAATTNNNTNNDDAEDGTNEHMKKAIPVRPRKQPKPKGPSTTSFFSDRPLLPRSSNKKKSANKPSPKPSASKATASSPAISDTNVASTTATTTTNEEPASKENKCKACEKVGKGKCQVVKRGLYFGACLRCVTRGEMKKCSLYEG